MLQARAEVHIITLQETATIHIPLQETIVLHQGAAAHLIAHHHAATAAVEAALAEADPVVAVAAALAEAVEAAEEDKTYQSPCYFTKNDMGIFT